MPAKSWVECVRDQLKSRGFGEARANEIETKLVNMADRYRRAGELLPEERATSEIMNEIAANTRVKARQTMLTLERVADEQKIFEDNDNNVTRNFKNKGYAPIAASYFEYDPRVNNPNNLASNERAELSVIFRSGDNVISKIGKGFFGAQRGKAILSNIPREIIDGFGSTKDKKAEAVARSVSAMFDTTVDRMNAVGGDALKLDRYMPQLFSRAKLFKGGKEAYIKLFNKDGILDWDRMAHPDGSEILPSEREQYLGDVWDTLTTGGVNKTPDYTAGANGANIGNQLDKHRQLHFASGDAWLKAFEAYGDGNVFDAIVRHVTGAARQIALVKTFGSNPAMGMARLRTMALHNAAKKGADVVDRTRKSLSANMGFDGMSRLILGQNPTSEYGALGEFSSAFSGVLRAAQLGSAVMSSVAPDSVSMFARRAARNGRLDFLSSTWSYFRSITSDIAEPFVGKNFMEDVFARHGFISDDYLNGLFQNKERFTYFNSDGVNKLGEFLGNSVWRASFAGVHDRAMRRVTMNEHMGFLHSTRKMSFEKLPDAYKDTLRSYDISPQEWDDFRNNNPETRMAKRAAWMVPSSILNTELPNKETLFTKFSSLVHNEAYLEFMDRPTVALQAFTSNATKANGFLGTIARSTLMYKAFPLTWTMSMHRMIVSRAATNGGRTALWAAMAAAMTGAGALTVWAKDYTQGKSLASPDAKFFARAMFAGGGLGLMGDILNGSAKDSGYGVNDVVSGPLIGLMGSAAYAGYSWVNYLGGLADIDAFKDDKGQATTFEKAAGATVKFLERYTPGSSLWYARLILQREFFDQIDLAVNPQGASKAQKAQSTRARKDGTPYWWEPGENISEIIR